MNAPPVILPTQSGQPGPGSPLEKHHRPHHEGTPRRAPSCPNINWPSSIVSTASLHTIWDLARYIH
ncbi:MAG TPA: hypothetical protein VGN34_24485 [Ktedonobacteraceae bacterium]